MYSDTVVVGDVTYTASDFNECSADFGSSASFTQCMDLSSCITVSVVQGPSGYPWTGETGWTITDAAGNVLASHVGTNAYSGALAPSQTF